MCAHGLRNVLGFDWHPDTGELWGADHGSDWRRDDVPPDELTLLEDSAHYGWPCCWGERRPDWLSSAEPPDGTPKEQFCAERTKGMTLGFAARSAGIDSLFYDGEQFPEEYRGDAFIAPRGSCNREVPVGYKVVRVRFEDGRPGEVQDFFGVFLTEDRQSHFGRIAGLAVDNDGALLVSEDTNGVIYRISHQAGAHQPRWATEPGRRGGKTIESLGYTGVEVKIQPECAGGGGVLALHMFRFPDTVPQQSRTRCPAEERRVFTMAHPTSSTGRGWSTTQLAWSCIGSFVAGAVVLYAAGFHWVGQWQTGDDVARKLAVAGCVQQFLLQPDRGLIHAELKANTSSYQRRQLIQKNNWAADREVAGLCDQQIQAMDAALFETPQDLPEEAAAGKQPA